MVQAQSVTVSEPCFANCKPISVRSIGKKEITIWFHYKSMPSSFCKGLKTHSANCKSTMISQKASKFYSTKKKGCAEKILLKYFHGSDNNVCRGYQTGRHQEASPLRNITGRLQQSKGDIKQISDHVSGRRTKAEQFLLIGPIT